MIWGRELNLGHLNEKKIVATGSADLGESTPLWLGSPRGVPSGGSVSEVGESAEQRCPLSQTTCQARDPRSSSRLRRALWGWPWLREHRPQWPPPAPAHKCWPWVPAAPRTPVRERIQSLGARGSFRFPEPSGQMKHQNE